MVDEGLGLFGDDDSVETEMDAAAEEANAYANGELEEKPLLSREKPEQSTRESVMTDKRVAPHHTEGEQALIASVLHDQAGLTFQKAVGRGITNKSFYMPAHQVIWECLERMHAQEISADEITLVRYLDKMGELEAIGGISYLNEVLNRVETHAHAKHYIDIVVETATMRGIVRSSQGLIEAIANKQDLESVMKAIGRMDYYTKKLDTHADFELVPLTSFKRPPKDSPDRLLGKYRWLCRGSGNVLIGPAGMGKSSIALQACACWSCGRDFLGIEPAQPWRILIIQAEDDDGDIGEVWDSMNEGLDFSSAQRELITKNLAIVRDKVNTGERFLRKLPAYIEAHKPDIVILNPLLSFIGGDITKQEVASAFLRNGLNRINKDDKFAYILVHHTNKPHKSDGKGMNWSEYMYYGAGSAELANWPRAIICLEPAEAEGKFWLRFAKRGNRTGLLAKLGDPNSPEGCYFQPTTKLYIKHTDKTVELEGGGTAPMILWERIDEYTEDYASGGEKETKNPGPETKYNNDDILANVPTGLANAMTATAIAKSCLIEGMKIPAATLGDKLRKWRDDKIVAQEKLSRKWYKHETHTQSEL